MVTIAAVVTFGAILLGIVAAAVLDERTLDEQSWLMSGLMALALMPALYVYRFFMAAQHRANAAKVGPDQLPEVWAIYTNLLRVFELPYTPTLYVENGNGVVNAFALSCSMRSNYIILHAEIAVLAAKHPEIVRFVLAHELSHHKLGHVTGFRLAISMLMNMMVLPGKALSRAQEYSADRLAMAVCPEAADSILFLTVGPWMAGRTNPDAFEQQALEEERSLMVRIANISQTHPVMTKRFKALRDISRKGFDVHGSMF